MPFVRLLKCKMKYKTVPWDGKTVSIAIILISNKATLKYLIRNLTKDDFQAFKTSIKAQILFEF